jgi:pantothenate kinase type III
VATGGYSKLIAKKIPEIRHVNPLLTLEGLRFIYLRGKCCGEGCPGCRVYGR